MGYKKLKIICYTDDAIIIGIKIIKTNKFVSKLWNIILHYMTENTTLFIIYSNENSHNQNWN